MKTLAIQFARFGPYHLSRIESAREELSKIGWEVVGLETGGADETYAWSEERGERGWERVTVFPGEAAEGIEGRRLKKGMQTSLDSLKPDAVAIAGWGSVDARACLDWCRKNGAKAIVMSETREVDGLRVWWKEWIKSRIIRRFDAALVGGKSHRDYLVKLGMPAERVRFGYNVVDNGHFTTEALKHRTTEASKPRPYFLASNRFIDRKNLARLVEAYARYCASAESEVPSLKWDLCLLGDGDLKADLLAQCGELGLRISERAPWEDSSRSTETPKHHPVPHSFNEGGNTVFFPGFRQIDELPRFYAHAGCFIHPALEEPWGLVLNEAMACGLPVLSGDNVGAAEELLDEGVNGWGFDASDVQAVAGCLTKVAVLGEDQRQAFGRASAKILENRYPSDAFGRGLADLV